MILSPGRIKFKVRGFHDNLVYLNGFRRKATMLALE